MTIQIKGRSLLYFGDFVTDKTNKALKDRRAGFNVFQVSSTTFTKLYWPENC